MFSPPHAAAPRRLPRWLALLAACAAPLLAQAQGNCTGDNDDDNYILGEAEGTASAMHWPTGLVWKRCIEGETFSSGACSTGWKTVNSWHGWAADYLPQTFAGQDAYGIAPGLSQNLLTEGKWRMAYQSELVSITQSCGDGPKVNRTVFPNTPFVDLWSGSPYAGDSDDVWGVNFTNGDAYNAFRHFGRRVRLVRAGQSFDLLPPSPVTQNAAAGTADVVFTDTITLGSPTNTTAWGGARIDGGAQFQVNGGGWVDEAIVKTGDTITVRMTAPATEGSSHTATLTVRSGQTTGTGTRANGGNESTAPQTATAAFTLNAIAPAPTNLTLPEGPQQGQPLTLAAQPANGWQLVQASAQTVASLGAALPAGVALPHGVVRLRLEHGAQGSEATVVLTYPQALPPGTAYYKFGRTADNPQPHWYPFPGAQVSGNTITLTLRDGGAGDDDLQENRAIDDPGGPALRAAQPAAIPTLGEWALALLAALLGLFSLGTLRRRAAGD